jgi:Ni/Fe-hydrogenase 1 B-type cytochrome subunit
MSVSTLPANTLAPRGIKRSLSVTVGRLKPIQGSEDELVTAAAAAVPLGSQNPADRAILQLAASINDLRHWQQCDVETATPESKLGGATVRHVEANEAYRVLRGDLEAVLAATHASEAVVDEARRAAAGARRAGFRSLAVASAPVLANGELGGWRLLGLIPLKARLGGKTPVSEQPSDWIFVPLWDVALRLMHWTAVTCIVLLIGTGYMIATPFLAPGTGAPQPYLMGYIRLIHYTAAWVLIATAVVRIADLFLSPYPYARWRALWPIQNKVEFKALVDVLRGYLFLRPHQNPTWIGLNPLQALTYTAVYGLAIFMAVTGLALYGLYNPSQWPFSWFQWLNTWFGADTVRMAHYIGMWLFLIFIPAHVYLSARSDTVDRGGAISSMINGGVWVRKNAPVVDAEHYGERKSSAE